MQRFPLAEMSGLILWLTILVLPLPLLMFWIAWRSDLAPAGWLSAVFMTLIYLFVWLYMRPSHFEISQSSLDVVWPVRRFSLPRSEIENVELLSGAEFRERYGYGMRIGAGGLWGGFGLLKTKSVTFRFYISRMEGYVIVWPRTGRPLLITPAEPQSFVRALATS